LPWSERLKYRLAAVQSRKWEGDIADASLATQVQWTAARSWEGFGKEFMPPLDEGSYLYMPITMPHASIGEAMDVLSLQDRRINAIPEVELAVGKIGRVRSPLDPAPVSMIETVINYRPLPPMAAGAGCQFEPGTRGLDGDPEARRHLG